MPCYDARDSEDNTLCQKRLQAATRAACEMASVLDTVLGDLMLSRLSLQTGNWIRMHRAMDDEQNCQKSAANF